MSLFEPPFTFRYRCTRCKVRIDDTRDKLAFIPRQCPKCGKRMEETRIVHMGLSTDSTFTKGWDQDDGFGTDERARKKARAAARAAGVNPEGKKYFANLAKRQYDPEAWMSDKHDVKKRCEMNGWECNGSVKVKGVEFDEPSLLEKKYQVDSSLVEKEIETKELLAGERFGDTERKRLKEDLITAYSGEQD